MNKFTPGPWRIGSSETQIYSSKKHIATCHYAGDPSVDFTESRANALLIASAPDLLKALEHLASYRGDVPPDALYRQALRVIAMAKGEEP